jgi:hypothetical protein
VTSDANPDNDWEPSAQYVQARPPTPPRSTGSSRRIADRVFINGRQFNLTPGQATQLDLLTMQRDVAVARLREIEPNWRPRESIYEGFDGLISAVRGETDEAKARFIELQDAGVCPGPYAEGSILAQGAGRRFTRQEGATINILGSESGCHTCGTPSPGTPSGNWVPDHQLPNAINPPGTRQRLYPQCLTCSQRQGGWLKNHLGDWQ